MPPTSPTTPATPSATPGTPAPGTAVGTAAPIPVQYDSGPSGELVVPEAGVAALGRTRSWVLISALMLFIIAGLGLLVSGMAGAGAIANRRAGNSGDFVFLLLVSTGFAIFTLAPLTGGICLLRLHAAIRRAYHLRRPRDLERLLLAQLLLWRAFPSPWPWPSPSRSASGSP